ncbi:MAG: hypothetical protein ACHQ0J_06665 [Candidatus Dormibacterales bacterium]
MMSGGLLRATVTICAVLAGSVVGSAFVGHPSVGLGLGAGLMLGSLNGYLIQLLFARGAPFRAASIMRLVMFSSVAVLAALLLREVAWSFPLGIGTAQLVMVGAGVRQGLRA